MYVVCSTFRLAPENVEDIDTLYEMREHLVDTFEGFLGIDVFTTAHERVLDLARRVRIQPGLHSIKYFNHVAS